MKTSDSAPVPPWIPRRRWWGYWPEAVTVVAAGVSVDSHGGWSGSLRWRYFGPKPLPGKEANWIQTVPGKGWWVSLRLYGPTEPWFDKTWRPGEMERIDH